MFNAANRKRPFKAVGAPSSSSSKGGGDNDNDVVGGGDGGTIDIDPDRRSNVQVRKSSTPPTTVTVNGVEIHFPFTPYDVQREYMEGVVTALQGATNALLESPTGTGKTLCLLCAALAWQRHERGRIESSSSSQRLPPPSQESADDAARPRPNDDEDDPSPNSDRPPVIIYASRTHSQLSQVVNELRNTRYRPKHAVLGSREHMCVHPKVNPSVANRRRNNSRGGGGGKNSDGNNDSVPAFSSDAIHSTSTSSSKSADVNSGCNKLNKGQRKCQFRNNLDDLCGKNNNVWRPPSNDGSSSEDQPVLDMEDLVEVGKSSRICPFYHTRSLLKDEPGLIFVPYNYLFDRDARESTFGDSVNFDNAVLIFDEAHNLEEFASESSSFDITSADVAACVSEVQRALQYMEALGSDGGGGEVAGLKRHNVLSLKSVFLRFEKYLAESASLGGVGGDGGGGGSSHPGEFIFDIFEQGAGITHDNLMLFVDFVKKLSDFVMESSNASSSGTPKLDHFLNCLKRAFGSGSHLLALARAKSYRVHVTKMNAGGGGFSGGRTVSFWCFAPALAMRDLSFLKVRSIIITSGTLSPLPSCAVELGLKFPVQLENDHVIQSDQIFVRVIGKGVSGKELSSKFGRRDDPEYITELGNTLASLCGNIPGGMLVFFPSYVAMEAAVQRWGGPASSEQRFGGRKFSGGGRGAAFFAATARKKQSSAKFVFPMVPTQFRSTTDQSSPWQRLLARKAIVLEPRSTSELSDAISEYKRFIAMPKSSGAILMGVCRGKISEGIDFSDDMCRAVIVTGLPFAPYLDPKVKLKREFLDAAKASAKSRPSNDGGFGNGKFPVKVEMSAASVPLSGAEWYNQQAHRACNQAIGRVIRHRHDYGAILLLDHRFAEVRNRDGLSKWLRPHLRDETFGATTRGLVQFYRESKAKAEKAKAFQQSKISDRPVIRYENSDEAVNIFSKVSVVKKSSVDEDALSNGYIPEELLMKRYDLNDLPAAREPKIASGEDHGTMSDRNIYESKSNFPAGLSAFYSKEKAKTLKSDTAQDAKTSSFGDIDKEPRCTDTLRSVAREQLKRRSQPGKKSDTAILQAKNFFTKAKATLSKDDLLKVNKLLVAMKEYGDSKNEQLYVKAAREIVSVLADSHVDSRRIQMIGLLFPLLPIKYRYKIETMAAALVFDKSPLQSRCKVALPEKEFSAVRGFVVSMIFNTSSSHDSIASNDREFLEDSQRIIDILIKNEVNLQCLFDLLPERQSRKVQTLVLELEISRNVAKAKERSANFKGENCINTVLFQPPAQKLLAVRGTQTSEPSEDAESQRIMTEALSQGLSVNCQRKDWVIENQNKAKSITQPFNPYQRSALKESRKVNLLSVTKGNGNRHANTNKNVVDVAGAMPRSSPNNQLDIIDRCLDQVKSDVFVKPQTRIERINGKIKAHVPRGMICMVCNESLKEPLMAESCRHSACLKCWTAWLKRSNTCPVCRAPTAMKDLSKVIFTNESGTPSLTQICASEDEGSDEEELEIVQH